MEILVVEDDARMAALLARGLREEGHVATVASTGSEAAGLALGGDFDLIVLDVMLPGMDGHAVARRLRQEGFATPILMLTARDTPRDVVAGLDSGADDYLAKPFSFEELLARIRALARRPPSTQPPVLEVAELRIDPATREVRRGERRVDLTRREFQVLELLARRPGRVLSRAALIRGVWGSDAGVETNTVDVFVSGLRKKIDAAGESRLIHTVRGVGFCLRGEEP